MKSSRNHELLELAREINLSLGKFSALVAEIAREDNQATEPVVIPVATPMAVPMELPTKEAEPEQVVVEVVNATDNTPPWDTDSDSDISRESILRMSVAEAKALAVNNGYKLEDLRGLDLDGIATLLIDGMNINDITRVVPLPVVEPAAAVVASRDNRPTLAELSKLTMDELKDIAKERSVNVNGKSTSKSLIRHIMDTYDN